MRPVSTMRRPPAACRSTKSRPSATAADGWAVSNWSSTRTAGCAESASPSARRARNDRVTPSARVGLPTPMRQCHPAPVEGLQDVRPECARSVARLDGQPHGWTRREPAYRPVGGEHRLARTGRTVDEGERPPRPGRHALQQLGPVHEELRHGRNGEPRR